jgi:nucleoside-diphosphate-sugar epimerase
MTILVTGGTGFLGSRVIPNLLARGHHVRCLVRSTQRGMDVFNKVAPVLRSGLHVFAGSLDRLDSCRGMVRDCDVVVHVAAPLVGSVSSLFANGVIPTRLLVNAAADRGVRRFVLVSSLAVYGTQNLKAGEVLDERCAVDSQPHLRDPYTYSKIAQEDMCWEAYRSRALPLVVIRPGVLFGPGRPLLTARIGLLLGTVLLQMDGWQTVPYCYVDNCARAVAMAADVADIAGMSFNILDDDLPSANCVLSLHRQHVAPVKVIRIPRCAIGPFAHVCEWLSKRSQGMFPAVLTPYKAAALWKRLRYSNELAKTRLDWRPAVPFSDAVARTVRARSSPLEST